MAECRAREFERERVRIRRGADVVPVEDELAQLSVPTSCRRREFPVSKTLRGRMRVSIESGLAVAGIAGPPTDFDLLRVPALRAMKSSDGGSAGKPENRLTARSNEPHHAFTGVERPR